jgi:RND family efflux transporter MFP subunit
VAGPYIRVIHDEDARGGARRDFRIALPLSRRSSRVRSETQAGSGTGKRPRRTAPAEQALLSSRASGIVAERRVDIGDQVKAGNVLVTIDAPEVEQELRRARASFDRAKARLALAEVNLARSEDLVGKGHTSVQTVDERRATKLTAEADVAAALAEVQRLEEVRSFQTIRAPFDGTIVARASNAGTRFPGMLASKAAICCASLGSTS